MPDYYKLCCYCYLIAVNYNVYQMRVWCILPRYKYCLFFLSFCTPIKTTYIGRNVCINICTEIRSDYHPLLCSAETTVVLTKQVRLCWTPSNLTLYMINLHMKFLVIYWPLATCLCDLNGLEKFFTNFSISIPAWCPKRYPYMYCLVWRK